MVRLCISSLALSRCKNLVLDCRFGNQHGFHVGLNELARRHGRDVLWGLSESAVAGGAIVECLIGAILVLGSIDSAG